MENTNWPEPVHTCSNDLLRLAYSYLKNTQEAEDAVQEAFLNAVARKIQFESIEHAKAWLARCTINICKNKLRSPWHKIRAAIAFGAVVLIGTGAYAARKNLFYSIWGSKADIIEPYLNSEKYSKETEHYQFTVESIFLSESSAQYIIHVKAKTEEAKRELDISRLKKYWKTKKRERMILQNIPVQGLNL